MSCVKPNGNLDLLSNGTVESLRRKVIYSCHVPLSRSVITLHLFCVTSCCHVVTLHLFRVTLRCHASFFLLSRKKNSVVTLHFFRVTLHFFRVTLPRHVVTLHC